ncbi:hypothetical protein WIV_gp011 [Wiseana iridescent virus]|uniref:Uncharacterized protein n=1 Tax=Wiseana iridescent virus TaxID=68347 RepID=G0T537_IRV9|nr:hypothetical protein WIV_gp011 [Wiseana iridescent virus]ADO00354.1 hypothetical protein [Wiseana iridescent virus]
MTQSIAISLEVTLKLHRRSCPNRLPNYLNFDRFHQPCLFRLINSKRVNLTTRCRLSSTYHL